MQLKTATISLLMLLMLGCTKRATYIFNEGLVYGTVYHIVYESPDGKDLQPEIEELFTTLGNSFSTFIDSSVISKVNKNESVELDSFFLKVYNKAIEVSEKTDGAFDITVMPMVNAWGFGFQHKEKINQDLIDSLIEIVGYKKIKLQEGRIIKDHLSTMLDMSAIAKGFTCDMAAEYLKKQGCNNYMVEIGGEVVVKGKNKEGKNWSIGISDPDENSFFTQELQAIIRITDKGLATSGNYRNFYVEEGKKYAHTIDPKTGYPVQHSLLSATVLADDCMTADAYATSFMVMGLEKGVELSKRLPEIDVYFIYADDDGLNKIYMSENFKSLLAN